MLGRDAWLSVWAKSVYDEHGVCTNWLPLHQHLDDTMAVAGQLVDEWVSPQVVRRIASDLPDGADGVRVLACWLAGVHDVGKASPAFAVQVGMLADHMRRFGLATNPRIADDPKRREVSHAIVGHLAVRDWLSQELGLAPRGIAAQLGSVVGGHHGVPPEPSQLALAIDRPDLVGDGGWAAARRFFLDRATERVGGREVLARYRDVRLSLPTQALLTAIVIVADWIASNDELFPLRPVTRLGGAPSHPDDAVTAERLATGWARLNLPPRWSAPPPSDVDDRLFQQRFDRPGAVLRPVQRAALDAATAQTQPGMIVIEAPMGSGKTEAALLAAEVLAHRSGADGLFVALPTQATTDAMFSRVHTWLERLPRRAAVSLRLAHGKAHLNDEYGGLVRRSRYVGDEADEVVVHQWFAGRKRAGLASFVVGTIDQVLFAGLKSRHVMLRHLALAGKVVVIDEVHAYDVYMSQYLHRVLHWLGAYRVPVILLSATLPPARRAELLRAYDGGTPTTGSGYPLISGTAGLAPTVLPLPADRTPVRVDKLDDTLETVTNYLRNHLAEGGCAVVVRNTVARVQETAEHLAALFGADTVSINHSRFLACDRARNDRELVHRFGPPNSDTNRASDRPDLHIVVASQVVEQSLDLDFDLMVTDLAPVDLLLQRLGRLHRHERDRPRPVKQPRCAVVGVSSWDETPVTAVRGSRRVYGDHLLLRAAAILHDRAEIVLPHDIAPLVRLAYGSTPVGPDAWQAFLAKAEESAMTSAHRRREAASAFLLGEAHTTGNLTGWLRAGVGDTSEDHPRGVAQVRDGGENLEVLVVQQDADGGLLLPDWLDSGGTQIPLDEEVPYPLARVVATCTLRLPLALSHEGIIDAVIKKLEHHRFTSFDRSPLLAGHLVLVLDEHRRAELHGFRLTYDPRRGLIHERLC